MQLQLQQEVGATDSHHSTFHATSHPKTHQDARLFVSAGCPTSFFTFPGPTSLQNLNTWTPSFVSPYLYQAMHSYPRGTLPAVGWASFCVDVSLLPACRGLARLRLLLVDVGVDAVLDCTALPYTAQHSTARHCIARHRICDPSVNNTAANSILEKATSPLPSGQPDARCVRHDRSSVMQWRARDTHTQRYRYISNDRH